MKYNIGDKFVIEIGERFVGSNYQIDLTTGDINEKDELFRAKNYNTLVFDENGLDKLDRLDDDYINEHYGMFQDAAYQKGLEDAWEIAKKVIFIELNGGIGIDGLNKIFGCWQCSDILEKFTASEALEKIREYKTEKIVVGDEVCRKDRKDCKVVVTGINIDGSYDCMNWQGSNYTFTNECAVKTGRHFPQIAEVLEQMKEETE